MCIRAVILSCALLFCSRLLARNATDVVVMTNGDRITCEIKGLSGGVLSVKVSYIQGTIGLQWSKVAHLESNQLFLVQTEDGTIYNGTLSAVASSGEQPVRIRIAIQTEKTVEIPQSRLVKLDQSADRFWRRFNGTINTGVLYSKGNESTQYNISSLLEYKRDHWSGQAMFNSTFASSNGANVSTRNETDLSCMRFLRWNKWFYSGTGSFLQSSVQGIGLQTTLGGGIGRYLRNTNHTSLYILGGVGWQNTQYETDTVIQGAQNNVVALISAELKAFSFKKTNLDVSVTVFPGISDPGRVRVSTEASYYIKLYGDLSWNFSFYGNWYNQAPVSLSGSDYGTSSGISWTFGNK